MFINPGEVKRPSFHLSLLDLASSNIPATFYSLFVGKVQERNLKPTPGALTNLERFPNPNLDGISSDLVKAISGINSGTRG